MCPEVLGLDLEAEVLGLGNEGQVLGFGFCLVLGLEIEKDMSIPLGVLRQP